MKFSRTLLIATVAVLAASGQASAQALTPDEERARFPIVPTPTTLYFHINGFQEFPINTQQPDDSFKDTPTIGALTNSASCQKDPSGQTNLMQEFHTFYGYVSPSYVQYDVIENGQPRIHQERGIAYDVQLGGDFTLKWYLESQFITGDPTPDANALPASMVVPDIRMRATMRAGDAISVGNEAYNEGAVIAEGVAGPFTLAGPATGQVPSATSAEGSVNYTQLGNGHHLYEITVPMKVSSGVIPREEGANLRIDIFTDNPACPDPEKGYLMPNTVRIHTSPQHRPRMDMVVNNPIMIPYLHPQFVAGDLVVHAQLNSPWGNYDVDEKEGGIEVQIKAQDGPTIAKTLERPSFIMHSLDHNRHQEAVDATYLWDYKAEAAPNGVYVVTVKVRNDQHTAEAIGTSTFQIGKGGDLPACDDDLPPEEQFDCVPTAPSDTKASPGAGILVGAVLLVSALVARRRFA